jgi:nickel-dependent lactate racemase
MRQYNNITAKEGGLGMHVKIAYGRTGIDLNRVFRSAEVLVSRVHEQSGEKDEDGLVQAAMARPIGSPSLRQLAIGKRTATILISDHTRPVPSQHILPFMLQELREGNPDIEVTLLVATGFHRETTPEELISKVGRDIYEQERIVVHDCEDEANCIPIGVLPSGAKLVMNRLAVETDLLVAEGFIEPHFFSGFSGGRKSAMPGVCSRTTVLGNHCSRFIDDPHSRAGILEGNLIHRDTMAAAYIAKLQYIVNVILDGEKRVTAAFAGAFDKAHEEGCRHLSQYCMVAPKKRGDIVVTSNGGAPLDQNVYQAVKGLTTAEAAAAPGGILIICATCADGIGGEGFYQTLKTCEDPAALLRQIRGVPMEETQPDQWQYQILLRMMEHHRIIFVCEPKIKPLIEDIKLEYAPTLEEALDRAFAEKGEDAHLVIIPDGISVVVAPETAEPEA